MLALFIDTAAKCAVVAQSADALAQILRALQDSVWNRKHGF
jgi:hypothetical protein